MTAVSTRRPAAPAGTPPIVLIHGAANSASVWTYWQDALAERGYPSHAIDLRGHGRSEPADLSRTSMQDYADDVRSFIATLDARPVVAGWSMGGLVALMVAAAGEAAACIGLAPSAPARSRNASVELRSGEYGAEQYNITSDDPVDQPAMPDLAREERAVALASLCRESRYASDDRKAGIVIESLPCPLLIVTGAADRQWPRRAYDGLWLDADYIEVTGASHWGLVLNRRALATLVPNVTDWVIERTSTA